MIMSLVLCLSTAGWRAADPPRSLPVPALPFSDRAFLEQSRRYLNSLKETIAWEERLIADVPELFAGERGDRVRRQLDGFREDVRKQERWVRELERFVRLREGDPGSGEEDEAIDRLARVCEELWGPPAVAPMPREKK